MRSTPTILSGLLALLSAAGCSPPPPQALGTLEYERVTLPAPAAERIVEIAVREGQRVERGQTVLRLEAVRVQAAAQAADAQARTQREALAELEAGPRSEAIGQARAQLVAAQARARDAAAYYARLKPLGDRSLVAASDVDSAGAAAASAQAQVRVAQQALLELERGTRTERIAQGRAAVEAAQAQARVQQVSLEKLDVTAPRAGRVDSLPFELGDQPAVGAPLAVLLVGPAPYARIYVPEPLRTRVRVGQAARVFVPGHEAPFAGTVRMVRSEPTFTPYYALTGKDAARLSYLAEVALTPKAGELPAGLPVRVEFADAP
ncbi:HlyD family secretion protein [Agrilutibacter solisilvae]|uniref:HlyD family efflux transporter periplasmic adaptor subunit n=1 Tax=Agrilutibacter solisilvae TaxID=2763317 RepID=A0A975ASQ9_9GAMM|nr:HlyD family efflux transporter periplasmic adaptor subunit [Lysobacter solisilvae]QSX78324.1 HlyD family efflux transporter periplasmic adaptor subunit [Lysobacter solisilvae]